MSISFMGFFRELYLGQNIYNYTLIQYETMKSLLGYSMTLHLITLSDRKSKITSDP